MSQKNTHILTISVEEYFHAGAFFQKLRPKHWDRLEQRLDHSISLILNQLNRFDQTATFFVLGCIADQRPDLIAKIMADGHEVASSSYWPRSLEGVTVDEFRDDLARTRVALENAGVGDVSGFRTSRNWLRKKDLWILDILAELGYDYDSSLNPALLRFVGQPKRYRIHTHQSSSGRLVHEFPVTTFGLLGFRIGITGGNWIRQLPHTLLSRVVQYRQARCSDPMVFYFMPWELDRGQPQISGLPAMTRVRHYRNLGKTNWVFEYYLKILNFTSIRNYLELPQRKKISNKKIISQHEPAGISIRAFTQGKPVSLVIPLFNEEENISYLKRTLIDLRKRLAEDYRIHLILVDDGSEDETWQQLNLQFKSFPDCQLVQQPQNMGVAAAILAGVGQASTEIVCSIDCDCSYDPNVLGAMIPLIDDADLVTASPYHPEGHVFNVPSWRLFLSKTLSKMYSMVLQQQLYTFTSCCRVYRKSAVSGLEIKDKGFLGIAETLVRLNLNGARIVEYPATLESRVLGESKMKILHTIIGHLRFLKALVMKQT